MLYLNEAERFVNNEAADMQMSKVETPSTEPSQDVPSK